MKKIIAIFIATLSASLCCITPLLAVLAGTSSYAASFSWLAPYHNYLIALTVIILLYAWYDKLKESKDIACCDNGFFSSKKFLAMVTIFVVTTLTFPQWGSSVFESAPTAESCATGACVSSEPEPKKEEKTAVILSDLPVLQYMNDETKNPTECGQVACTGTGYTELDEMMRKTRKNVLEMSPAVLKKMLDNDEDLVLIDVREFIQRAEGEIYASDSYAIARTNLEFEILNKVQNKESTVVLYSRQGARSLFAAESIQKLGYKHVYNLSAGLKGWVRAGYPYDNGLGTVIKVVDEQ